ncbi:hypothetical protein L1887_03245 [Cichorium endivia]|nr:hypothetical protein L1887_03245 [Cichorium endivia]
MYRLRFDRGKGRATIVKDGRGGVGGAEGKIGVRRWRKKTSNIVAIWLRFQIKEKENMEKGSRRGVVKRGIPCGRQDVLGYREQVDRDEEEVG